MPSSIIFYHELHYNLVHQFITQFNKIEIIIIINFEKKKILNRKRRIKGDFRSLIWKIIQEGRYRMRMLSDTIGGSIDLARLCTAQYICTAINFTNFPSGKETIESIESPLESQDRL